MPKNLFFFDFWAFISTFFVSLSQLLNQKRIMMIGREQEQEWLHKAYNEDESKFVAVYGRRRVGKTFLIRECFEDKFVFQHSGVAKANTKIQLRYFKESLQKYGFAKVRIPKDWIEAFSALEQLIEKSTAKKKVVFIDEIPWMDTPRSNFVTALEFFWNNFASARKDILLIICGSATSWIINKVLKNHGGLHNRVNLRISLQPFTLHECELYSRAKGIRASRYELLEYYMVLGGVAFYWSLLDKGKSVAQNLDDLFFSETGQLHNEFNELYDSLFANPEPYIKIIHILGSKKVGMPRANLLEELKISSGANVTRILEDLEECGFIRKYHAYGKKRNDAIFQLIDNFTLFYFKFLKSNTGDDEHYWSHSYLSPIRFSWAGLAFERVCMQHIKQIKLKLGISGVLTNVYSWAVKADPVYGTGAQIDMLIDRADNVVNVCEMKFTKDEYVIDKEYSQALAHKIERLLQTTKTRKSLHLTMITVNGVAHNEYWGDVQSEVVADDLFHE